MSTDYAIRIVLHLAVKGGAATSSEISGQMGIPRSVIATLAKPLQKAGILTTQRGTGGGFALGRRPEDISLHEIVNLMEGTTRINRCLEPDGFCSRKGTASCSAHRFFLREQEKLERSFREMTIAKLLSDEKRVT